jgi:hypothetical protein
MLRTASQVDGDVVCACVCNSETCRYCMAFRMRYHGTEDELTQRSKGPKHDDRTEQDQLSNFCEAMSKLWHAYATP